MEILSKETWVFINSFSPWLSAIGTIAAVIVSLHLARRERRIRLEVSAGYRLLATQGQQSPHPAYLYINAVNIGHRDAQIINVGWKVGLLRKKYGIQATFENEISNSIPIRLRDGEEAKFLIPLDEKNRWLDNLIEEYLHPFPKIQVNFVKVQIFTSLGKTFEAKIEKGLKKKIQEKIKGKYALIP